MSTTAPFAAKSISCRLYPHNDLDAQLPSAWRHAMTDMAAAARAAYRNLVYATPGFLDYWQAATPLNEISELRIGSRPSVRRGGAPKVHLVDRCA